MDAGKAVVYGFGMNKTSSKQAEAKIATLNRDLAGIREQYVTRAKELGAMRVEKVAEKLAENDWSKSAAFPQPGGNCSRMTYLMMDEARKYASKLTQADEARNRQDPDRHAWQRAKNYVTMRPDASAIAEKEYVAEAHATVDAYIAKLAGKIDGAIESVTVNGSLWDGSVLTVKMADQTQQRWSTKCIINQSCLGKLFNQWPTRRV